MMSIYKIMKMEPKPGRCKVAHVPHITTWSYIVVAEPQHAATKVHGFNGQASHQAPHGQRNSGSRRFS